MKTIIWRPSCCSHSDHSENPILHFQVNFCFTVLPIKIIYLIYFPSSSNCHSVIPIQYLAEQSTDQPLQQSGQQCNQKGQGGCRYGWNSCTGVHWSFWDPGPMQPRETLMPFASENAKIKKNVLCNILDWSKCHPLQTRSFVMKKICSFLSQWCLQGRRISLLNQMCQLLLANHIFKCNTLHEE